VYAKETVSFGDGSLVALLPPPPIYSFEFFVIQVDCQFRFDLGHVPLHPSQHEDHPSLVRLLTLQTLRRVCELDHRSAMIKELRVVSACFSSQQRDSHGYKIAYVS
jgi:hypothetical protein